MSAASTPQNIPLAALKAWVAEDAEGRVMTVVEDPSIVEYVSDLLEQLEDYERADQAWQRNFDLVTEQKKRILEQFETQRQFLEVQANRGCHFTNQDGDDLCRIEWPEMEGLVGRWCVSCFSGLLLEASSPVREPQ